MRGFIYEWTNSERSENEHWNMRQDIQEKQKDINETKDDSNAKPKDDSERLDFEASLEDNLKDFANDLFSPQTSLLDLPLEDDVPMKESEKKVQKKTY